MTYVLSVTTSRKFGFGIVPSSTVVVSKSWVPVCLRSLSHFFSPRILCKQGARYGVLRISCFMKTNTTCSSNLVLSTGCVYWELVEERSEHFLLWCLLQIVEGHYRSSEVVATADWILSYVLCLIRCTVCKGVINLCPMYLWCDAHFTRIPLARCTIWLSYRKTVMYFIWYNSPFKCLSSALCLIRCTISNTYTNMRDSDWSLMLCPTSKNITRLLMIQFIDLSFLRFKSRSILIQHFCSRWNHANEMIRQCI